MAKKKAKATKRSSKPAPRKTSVKKTVKKAAKATRKPLKTKKKAAATRKAPAKRAAPKTVVKKATKKRAVKPVKKAVKKAQKTVTRPVAKPAAKRAMKQPVPKPKAKPTAKAKALAPADLPVPARLQRERKRLPEAEMEELSADAADSRLLSSARTGHDELRSELKLHTEASPELTAGDVDAKWQDAYALGDEAPGGDNMTPDQDRVDDIGKALGVVYDDDEELRGGDEIAARDEHRWELDPASKEDEDES